MGATKLVTYGLRVAGLVSIALVALTGAQCTVAGCSASADLDSL